MNISLEKHERLFNRYARKIFRLRSVNKYQKEKLLNEIIDLEDKIAYIVSKVNS